MPLIVKQSSQTGAGVAVGAAVGVAVNKGRRVGVGTGGGVGSQAERVIKTISAISRYPVRFPVIDSFLDIPETPIRIVPRGQRSQRRSV
jgi:hypothetical protein